MDWFSGGKYGNLKLTKLIRKEEHIFSNTHYIIKLIKNKTFIKTLQFIKIDIKNYFKYLNVSFYVQVQVKEKNWFLNVSNNNFILIDDYHIIIFINEVFLFI